MYQKAPLILCEQSKTTEQAWDSLSTLKVSKAESLFFLKVLVLVPIGEASESPISSHSKVSKFRRLSRYLD